jgi:hypothetical protein
MIPREILKKIRQIELRTNRIVTGSAGGGCVRRTSRSTPEFSNAPTNHHALRLGLRPQPRSGKISFEPLPQRVGIPAGMPDGEHTNFIAFDPEINSVFESGHPRLANESGFFLKKFGVLFDAFKQREKFGVEFLPQTRLPFFIPFQRLKVISVGGRFEPQPLHFQPKRLRASSRTCSNGIPSRGFLLNSSARRSSSVFCSGVIVSSKSPNSRSMVSTSSRRSISGIRRSSSRISVALMESNLTAVKLFASA